MNTKTLGFGLISFGLILLLMNFYQLQVDWTLLFLGTCFLTAYFGNFVGPRKNIGFLIPGCILAAMGVWDILGELTVVGQYEDVGFFAAIGTAFLAIYVIGSANGHKVFWASIVSLAVYGFGAFIYLVTYSSFFAENEDLIFPFVMIAIGLVIVVGSSVAKIRKR